MELNWLYVASDLTFFGSLLWAQLIIIVCWYVLVFSIWGLSIYLFGILLIHCRFLASLSLDLCLIIFWSLFTRRSTLIYNNFILDCVGLMIFIYLFFSLICLVIVDLFENLLLPLFICRMLWRSLEYLLRVPLLSLLLRFKKAQITAGFCLLVFFFAWRFVHFSFGHFI